MPLIRYVYTIISFSTLGLLYLVYYYTNMAILLIKNILYIIKEKLVPIKLAYLWYIIYYYVIYTDPIFIE